MSTYSKQGASSQETTVAEAIGQANKLQTQSIQIMGDPLPAAAVCELPSPYLRQLGERCPLAQARPN